MRIGWAQADLTPAMLVIRATPPWGKILSEVYRTLDKIVAAARRDLVKC